MADFRRTPVPVISDVREALLQASIANDPENPEITEAEFAKMRPASDVLPPALYATLTRGRPNLDAAKVAVELQLDAIAVDAFKAAGVGWESRMNGWLAHRQDVVDLVSKYETALIEMRALLQQLRDAVGDFRATRPSQIKLIEGVERQIAITETAAFGVREVLKDQAIFGQAVTPRAADGPA